MTEIAIALWLIGYPLVCTYQRYAGGTTQNDLSAHIAKRPMSWLVMLSLEFVIWWYIGPLIIRNGL